MERRVQGRYNGNGRKVAQKIGMKMEGSERDLAGLVCNNLGDETCINPKKGQEGGDTWEERFKLIGKLGDDADLKTD